MAQPPRPHTRILHGALGRGKSLVDRGGGKHDDSWPGPKQAAGQRRDGGGEIKEFKGLAAAGAIAAGRSVEGEIGGDRRVSARFHAWPSGQVQGGDRAVGRGAAGRTRTNGGTVALSTFFDARA